MSKFLPNKVYLRGILLHYFIQKKSAAEAHRILWVPYELKPRDVERRFGTCELLLQRQKRKGFLITGDRYRLQLMRLSRALKEKRPLYAQRHDKMILADRRFHSYEEAQKWIDSWIASKDMSFFRRGIHVLPERWSKVVESDGKYFH
ncbi:MOS1T transposase, partial [Pseudoatta argentina]